MVSFFVYPENVKDPGFNFARNCAIAIKTGLSSTGAQINEIIGCNATTTSLGSILQNSEIKHFLAFGHGSPDAITVRDDHAPVFELNQTPLLNNKICYFLSCCTGQKLGSAAMSDGACAFIGFAEEFKFPVKYSGDFLECCISGINDLLLGKCTLDKVEEITRNKFHEKYKQFRARGANIAASWFLYDIAIMVFYIR